MKYRRKPAVVEAVYWRGGDERYDAVCAMCSGIQVEPNGLKGIRILLPTGAVEVALGQWVVKEEGRIKAMADEEFGQLYYLAEE